MARAASLMTAPPTWYSVAVGVRSEMLPFEPPWPLCSSGPAECGDEEAEHGDAAAVLVAGYEGDPTRTGRRRRENPHVVDRCPILDMASDEDEGLKVRRPTGSGTLFHQLTHANLPAKNEASAHARSRLANRLTAPPIARIWPRKHSASECRRTVREV